MKKQIIVNILFLLFLISSLNALPSRRARCAVECYLKCVFSGTPNAVYCNCPDDFSECNSITDEFLRARTTAEVPAVETIYKDVRTIKVILKKPYPSSFIYVFEYSAVSDFSNKWIYAGSSSSPHMTFTIPDSCRDYQFRVLVVVRSIDPQNQLVVFQPRAIPVELPNFSVPTEMIRLDPPRQSSDGQSLHVFVSWQIPQGYFDSDIIGYESPVAYPIRCMIPEESLSQPRVEKVQDGARMHLNLPIDVLDENCRIYLEVRMLAKCERIIPFDVQASVELNCQKFPMLEYCKKEMSPQCAEIVDVWGENGKAQIVWQPPVPNRLPLYYQISHGVTRSQGAFPFVTRKIIQHHEIRIPGNQTRIEIPAQPGVQSGIQICGVFSERQSKNPFNIVPVIPFLCKTCGTNAQPNCIECTKVEDVENMVPIECLSQNCATNNLSTHFISMNTANLNIKDSKKQNIIVNSNALNPLQRHSKIISTDKAIPVNSDFEENPFQTNGTLDLLFGVTTDATGIDGGFDGGNNDSDLTSTTAAPSEESTTTNSEDNERSTTIENHEEEETTTFYETTEVSSSSTTESSTPSTTTTTTTPTTTVPLTSTTPPTHELPKADVRLMPIIPPSSDEASEEQPTETERPTTSPSTYPSATVTQPLPVIEYEKHPTNRHKADGIRLHPIKSRKPCKQKNGIICEFGCMDNLRCDCPKSEKSCIRGIHCPFVKDLRAIYENSTKTLKLFSKQISNVLKNAKIYDKIYLEFGEIGPATTGSSTTSSQPSMGINGKGVVGDFIFTTHEKERAVISLEHTNITKLFDEIPYLMIVEKPLKVGEVNYGLSVCALNSSLVPVIMDNVFMEQSLFNDNSISSFTQTLLSPIDLNEDINNHSDAAKRSLLLVGAPFLIIFITIILVGTFLCINIIRDKRRSPTEKFRRRGILRDASSTHFTGFRPNLGLVPNNLNHIHSSSNNNVTSIGITTPLENNSGGEEHRRQTSARFFPRNVHF